ncbi:transposase [Bradyrhizobium sp. B124]|uniref:transposase n=1 Tax=Bradyrhizobium sp. B124 TaxID=3140245 RepID=UPI0031846228
MEAIEEPRRAHNRLCGRLRASEVAGLRIEDIDSARGVIQVVLAYLGRYTHRVAIANSRL